MKMRFLALLLSLSLVLSGCVVVLDTAPETYPEVTTEATVQTVPETTAETTEPEPLEDLLVHYIDVGQADSILLESAGEYMLIDGGNRDDGQLVVTYLEEQGVQELNVVVNTHPHEDHVGGLPSVLAVYPTKAVYSPTKTYSSRVFDSFLRYVDQQGLEVTLPKPGDSFSLGDATVTLLAPVMTYPDPNDNSIVLRVDHGENSFLFTGDLETVAENDMMDYWDNDQLFSVDVLKVGHHGSNTSTGYRFLNAVMPTYGVIPVGKGNDYGHPHTEPMTRLRQAGVIALRTDLLGHILARSDGTQIQFTWQNQNAQPEDVEPVEALEFVGNKNSKTFHGRLCQNLPAEHNQVIFSSYMEAVESGYKPCGSCIG